MNYKEGLSSMCPWWRRTTQQKLVPSVLAPRRALVGSLSGPFKWFVQAARWKGRIDKRSSYQPPRYYKPFMYLLSINDNKAASKNVPFGPYTYHLLAVTFSHQELRLLSSRRWDFFSQGRSLTGVGS